MAVTSMRATTGMVLPRWIGVAARAALTLAYPLVILFAWQSMSPRYVGCLLVALLWLQRTVGKGTLATALKRLTPLDWGVAGALTVLSAAIAVTDSERLLHLYPACVSVGLLVAFGATLWHGPTMIEKFARLTYPEPSPEIVRYTRRVTQVWCAFFIANGSFSVYTALYWSRAGWALYNGLIAYVLIGALVAGEWLWRRFFIAVAQKRTGVA
ncbi:hypothetical protein WL93_05585 [Burkholderia diffusa]|uniref:COG4648 family protein n=1 Tax=Burkholderia diffusa TaxID=488732 RepID=UPI0007593242|nr:hypothetical protein [Burkholderia diffusa]KVC43330.1 hypothetical protein WI71_23005 [Burkholderia diffusa]KWF97937.1 hypothetical protein WL93_05585 [Burkholderia diffusa]